MLSTLLIGLGIGIGGMRTAAAQEVVFVQSKMGGVLEVASTAPTAGTQVRLGDFTGDANQQWSVERIGGLSEVLLRSSFGHYLSVRGGSAARGSGIDIMNVTRGPEQRWHLDLSNEAPWHLLRSGLGTFLDVHGHTYENGMRVQAWSVNQFYTQKWRFLRPRRVALPNLGTRCPSGPGLRFSGRPRIWASVELSLSHDRRKVFATTSFWAGNDSSAARPPHSAAVGRGDWVDEVFAAPVGQRIVGIPRAFRRSVVDYVGRAAGAEFLVCSDGEVESVAPSDGPVRMFHIIGDTGGDDVGSPGNCRCNTQIRSIELNPIDVVLEAG
jgi:hypothetical protein